MAIREIAAALGPLNFRRRRVGHFSRDSSPSQNWARMIVGRTKPEIYALRWYQMEIEGFHFVSSQVIGEWDSTELQCFVPCYLWKWGFDTSVVAFYAKWKQKRLSSHSLLWEKWWTDSHFTVGLNRTEGKTRSHLNKPLGWSFYLRKTNEGRVRQHWAAAFLRADSALCYSILHQSIFCSWALASRPIQGDLPRRSACQYAMRFHNWCAQHSHPRVIFESPPAHFSHQTSKQLMCKIV
jgi:hypothetical protein